VKENNPGVLKHWQQVPQLIHTVIFDYPGFHQTVLENNS